ncbi:hypothetical protein K2X33_14805 [bacterium]|nr:hypothetical protein [bacterium]
MKKLLSIGALLGSLTTIFCCFLPALFAVLGFGAVFAGLVGSFPQMIWLSEHKLLVFLGAGAMLGIAGYFQLRAGRTACPIDPKLAEGCSTAKNWSKRIYFAALALYALGFTFAFILPKILA